MELWSVVFVCCVLGLSVSYTAEAILTLPGNETIPALILFGDSIVDTGSNNNLLTAVKCNFPPYGRDFEGAVATGRFSNGKVPSDLIAEALGIGQYSPSYGSPILQPDDLLKGANFASGGSGYDPLTPQLVSVVPLSEQLNRFKMYIETLKVKFGEEKTNFILSKGLVYLVSGSNDIATTYFVSRARKAQYDIQTYTDFLVQAASSFVKELYGLGVRRIGVLGVPPLGCVPSIRTLFGGLLHRRCNDAINDASKLFNSKLSAELQNLNQSLSQSRVVYIDVYDPLVDIIENPNKYGFQVVDRGCCGTGLLEAGILCNRFKLLLTCPDASKYVFWDSFHPSQTTYQIIVDETLNKYLNSFA